MFGIYDENTENLLFLDTLTGIKSENKLFIAAISNIRKMGTFFSFLFQDVTYKEPNFRA